jgi:hypothetical protein
MMTCLSISTYAATARRRRLARDALVTEVVEVGGGYNGAPDPL